MAEEAKPVPFHEAIILLLPGMSNQELEFLAMLVKKTLIPKNHDVIAAAWNERTKAMGWGPNNDMGVTAYLADQKLIFQSVGKSPDPARNALDVALEKIAARREAAGEPPFGPPPESGIGAESPTGDRLGRTLSRAEALVSLLKDEDPQATGDDALQVLEQCFDALNV